MNRGLVYEKLNEISLAISDLDMSIKLDKNYLPAYYNRGIINYKIKNFQESIRDFTTCLKIQMSSIFFYKLGFSYEGLGDYNNSIDNLLRAGVLALREDNREIQLLSFKKILDLSAEKEIMDNRIVLAGLIYFHVNNETEIIKQLLNKDLKKVDKILKIILRDIDDFLANKITHDELQNNLIDQFKKIDKFKAEIIYSNWFISIQYLIMSFLKERNK